MELTTAGRAFEREVRTSLYGLDQAVQHARAIERGEAGLLRVGITTSAWLHPLTTRVMRQFSAALPGVDLQIRQAGTPELIAAIRAGELDAGIVRGIPAADGLRVTVMGREMMWLAVPHGHRFDNGSAAVRLSDLAGEAFIGYPRAPGEGLLQDVIAACAQHGFAPRFRYEAPLMLSALAMVAAGLGVAIVPNAARAIRLEGVVYRKLRRGEIAPAAMSFVISESGSADTAVRALQELVGIAAER
jgi:DNA-binding transcriptional LysR family regulator